MTGWLLATILGLSSPVSNGPEARPPAVQVVSPQLIAPNEVMAIPPDLKVRMDAVVHRGSSSATLKLQRLMHFIVDRDGLGLTYEPGATYTVAQAYKARKANCLTFTLMIVSLAESYGLDASPQETGETLLWEQVNGTFYRENHINTLIRIGAHRYTIDPTADAIIFSKPPIVVSHERLLAHFYDNLAVDELRDGMLSDALANVDRALKIDPGYASLWSNAGVIFRHAGNAKMAKDAYKRALMIDPSNASALFNLVQLLHDEKDSEEGAFRLRLAQVERRDPLQQFLEGLDYERSGDLQNAISRLNRAIQLKSDEHRFYAALGRIYERSGDIARAQSALWAAESLSSGTTKSAYEAERNRLKHIDGAHLRL